MLFLFVYFTIKFLNLHASIMLFVCGIYLYLYKDVIRNNINKFPFFFKCLLFVAGCLLFTIRFYLNDTIILFTDIIFTSFLLPGCFILFSLVITSDRLKGMLSKPHFIFLGKISYSLYLVHFTFIICFSTSILKIVNFFLIYNEYCTRLVFYTIMTLILLLISSLFYYFIEKPLMNFGKKIIINKIFKN